MPDWLSVLLGIVLGTGLIAGCLFWAFKPRPPGRASRLPPPSDTHDPMTAASMDHNP